MVSLWCEKRDLEPLHKPAAWRQIQVRPPSRSRKEPMEKSIGSFLVRETGLEPVRCKPHAPQTCASASSATLAFIHLYFLTRSRSPRSIISSNCRRFCDNISIIQQNFHFVNPFFKFFYFYYFCLNSSALSNSLLCQILKNS